MMLFSTGTGLERVGVVGSDLDCWWAGMQALGSFGWTWTVGGLGYRLLDRLG